MPKINVYLPDELAEAVREAGVPVSAVCQRALEQAVRRVTAIRETALGGLDDADLAAGLPHFTARARAVLGLGIEQARAAGSPAVGSGHLLGGLLAEGGNLALRVLTAIEIEPGLVGRELARVSLTEEGPAADADPPRVHTPGSCTGGSLAGGLRTAGLRTPGFSTPAATVLELTVTEATALGHNYVGCEHLLLGLIAEPDGVAGRVLRSLGAELRLTRRAVAAALAGYVHLRAQIPQATPPADAVPSAGPGTTTEPEGVTQPGTIAQPGTITQPEGVARPGVPADAAAMMTAMIDRALQPLLDRIERLERRAGEPGNR